MKRLLFVMMLSVIVMLGISTSASASIQTLVDDNTSVVTVDIVLENAKNKKVAVEVFNPGKGIEDIALLTAENIKDVYSYIREFTADAGGKISFSYKLSNISGHFSIRVRCEGAQPVIYQNAFTYLSPTFENDFLTEFCSSSTSDARRLELIEINAYTLEIDSSALSDGQGSPNLALIEFMGTDFTKIKQIKAAFECGIISQLITSGVADDDALSVFDIYAPSLASYCELFELYSTYFSLEEKYNLFKELRSCDISNISAFSSSLGSRLFLDAVKNADNHQNVEAILRVSEQWLGENFSDYYALSTKRDVNLTLINGSFATPAELCVALHFAVTQAGLTGPSSTVYPSGNGGSSVNVAVPPTEAPQEPTDNNDVNNETAFSDLADVPWAQEAIYFLKVKGVVNGISDSAFAPMDNVRREEFVKLIITAFFAVDSYAASDFDDVSVNHWSYPYVSTAVKLGIVQGTADKCFGLGNNITRQDMAVMQNRAIELAQINPAKVNDAYFTDLFSISAYAVDAVTAVAEKGIINGFEDGSFIPMGYATRAQASKVIYETIQRGGAK